VNDQYKERWLGYLRGSRTGTLFLFVDADGVSNLSIGFTNAGDLRLHVVRPDEGGTLELRVPVSGEVFGTAVVEVETDNSLRGAWSFTTGAAGTFELNRDEFQSVPAAQNLTAQVVNREVPLGAITLYRADLVRLIAEMESLVPHPNLTTIKANESGQIVAVAASTYLNKKDYMDVIRVMTISTFEVNDAPLKRIATVNLNDDGSSQLFISSPDELWTTAAAIRLEIYLTQFSSRFTGWLRKRGLTVNAFILMAIFIWMPDKPLVQRIVVFVIGVALITVIAKSHGLIPYNRVYLDPSHSKKPFAKEVPAASLAAVAGLVTAGLSSAPQIFEHANGFLLKVMHLIGF
jgi:hypothetical protein